MASTGVVSLYDKLVGWTIGIVPTLVKSNRALRTEIRDIVGSIADELERGIDLVILYLKGAKNITNKAEFRKYLVSGREKLFELHSEFKICRGLRELRDRFKQWFDPTKHAISWGNQKEVIGLIREMEVDERLIIDELGDFWPKLDKAIQGLNRSNDKWKLLRLIDEEIESLEVKKKKIKRTARQVIDLH